MKSFPNQSIPQQNIISGDKICLGKLKSHYPPIFHTALPSVSVKSEAMENGRKNGEKGGGEKEVRRVCGLDGAWQWAFVGMTVVQFFLQVGLILIQYISCQIQPPLFFIALLFALILHALLLALTITITTAPPPRHPHKDSQEMLRRKGSGLKASELGIPTVPKINQLQQLRGNAKTKKMKHADVEGGRKGRGERREDGKPQGLFSVKRKLLMVFKAIQSIFQLVVPSLELALSYPINRYSQVQVALASLDYLLAPASLLIFCFLLRRLRPSLHPQFNEPHSPDASEAQPMTRISIQNMIFHHKNSETHSVTLEKELRSPHNEGKSEPDHKIGPFVRREQLKKSVLKSAKTHGLRTRKASEDEEFVERRKVEFNSKKLQCFEYLEVTPPHDTVQEECGSKKLSEVVKGSGQKLKYLRHRLENQAHILRHKALQREGRSKSLGEVVRNSQEAHSDYKQDRFC